MRRVVVVLHMREYLKSEIFETSIIPPNELPYKSWAFKQNFYALLCNGFCGGDSQTTSIELCPRAIFLRFVGKLVGENTTEGYAVR